MVAAFIKLVRPIATKAGNTMSEILVKRVEHELKKSKMSNATRREYIKIRDLYKPGAVRSKFKREIRMLILEYSSPRVNQKVNVLEKRVYNRLNQGMGAGVQKNIINKYKKKANKIKYANRATKKNRSSGPMVTVPFF
tara:strand:+ start:50 stop:463 length:414 start_codon:yes stop_codon:yes gene_type:complete